MTGSTITLRSVLLNTAAAVAITAGLATTAPARANVGADAGAGAQDATAAQDAAGAGTSAGKAPGAAESAQRFDIPAQAAADALNEWARQANRQIVFPYAETEGRRTRALSGTMTPRTALQRLADPLGLKISTENATTITLIGRAAPGESLAAGGGGRKRWSSWGDGAVPEGQGGISEILVVGSRSQNVDIRRTENDPQPYVVFNTEEIEKSGATSVDDFLRQRLSMNAARVGANQVEKASLPGEGYEGSVDLRGLGTNQTLILVDGRRLPSTGQTELRQANISGIPTAAIQRIEVLPSTAGAIYGGSAVGGVVNIILKRKYSGIELQADYGNTIDFETGDARLSAVGGFSFDKTSIMLSASASRIAPLLVKERNGLLRSSRDLVIENFPSAIVPGSSPIAGSTPNICGVTAATCNGTLLILDDGTPLNSSITHVPAGYPGPQSDGGRALLANAGKYNLDAPDTLQSLIQENETVALGGSIRHSLSKTVELFGDANWDRQRGIYYGRVAISGVLTADSASNPFQQAIRINYYLPGKVAEGGVKTSTLRGSAGAIFRLPGKWAATVEQVWGRTKNRTESTSLNALKTGGVAVGLLSGTSDISDFPPDLTDFVVTSLT